MRTPRGLLRSVAIIVSGALLLLGATVAIVAQRSTKGSSRTTRANVYTTAHRSVLDAIKEFFDWRPTPVQPLAFKHNLHLANNMQCLECHTAAEQGPQAGIPSVKLCMTCHQVIATDRPEVKKVAAYMERGEEIPWERVYYFQPSAHVMFNHAPHLRAKVACEECHGDMNKQTVAVRSIDLDMGYCLNCHRQRKASLDCTTCHY